MSIPQKIIDDTPESIRYFAYGIGCSVGFFMFIFGVFIKFVIAKVKEILSLKQDVEMMKIRDEGRESFARALMKIEARLYVSEKRQNQHEDDHARGKL